MKKGISLITMMVAIVLVFIISSIVIYNVIDTNSLGKVNELKFKSDIKKIDYEIRTNMGLDIAQYEENIHRKITKTSEILKYSPSLNDSPYKNAAYIVNARLALYGNKLTKEEKQWAIEAGISVDGKYTNISSAVADNTPEVVISRDNVLAYFDCYSYNDSETTWKSEQGNVDMELSGNVQKKYAGVLIPNGSYGSIDISGRKTNDLVIYTVVRNNDGTPTSNRFIFEIPGAKNENNKTPHVAVYPRTSVLYYSTFGGANDVKTTVRSDEFNVIAFKMKSNDGGKIGIAECYINGEKQATTVNYINFGEVVRLSYSEYSSSFYGNNTFRMFAVCEGDVSELEIISNSQKLKEKYITNFVDERLLASVSDKVVTSEENLLSYFDYTSFDETDYLWKNEKNNGLDLQLYGSPMKANEGIRINAFNGDYATLDISDKITRNLTIYMVVKNNDNYTNIYNRIMEIPTTSGTSAVGYTPIITKTPGTGNVFIGGYGGAYAMYSTITALDFNVIAIKLTDLGTSKTIDSYINGVKQNTINYLNYGDIIYLSGCTSNANERGNNTFRMFAVYSEASDDETIKLNSENLRDRYITNFVDERMEKPVSSKVVTSTKNLLSYFDYTSFEEGSTTWKNERDNGCDLTLYGTCTKEELGIKMDASKGNYATFDISDRISEAFTIYIVVKNYNGYTGSYERIMEIPTTYGSTAASYTPCIAKAPTTGNIFYGTYGTAYAAYPTTSSQQFNVLAFRITPTNVKSGKVELFINGKKEETSINYSSYGNTIYLSNCGPTASERGNNTFKMFAVYNEASDDATVINNSLALKKKYIDDPLNALYTAPVTSKVAVNSANLLSYLDSTSFSNNTWNSEKNNNLNLSIVGTLQSTNDGVSIASRSGNYGTVSIEQRKCNDFTIYAVVRNDNAGSNAYDRIFQIPKNANGKGNTTNPLLYLVPSSNKIGYSTYGTNVGTQISAIEFNVITIRLASTNDTMSGDMDCFINGEKQSTTRQYTNYGDLIYLSHCIGSASECGNNTFRLLAVYNEVHSDEKVAENSQIFAQKYITNYGT